MQAVDALSAFAGSYVALLPASAAVEAQTPEYWSQLGVRVERVLQEAADANRVASSLSDGAGLAMLKAFAVWLGLGDMRTKSECVAALAGRLASDVDSPCCQEILHLLEYVRGMRHDAIAMVGKRFLDARVSRLIDSAGIGDRSSRLAYTMQLYHRDPGLLQLAQLLERAEVFSYQRHLLVPKRLDGRRRVPDQQVALATSRVAEGMDLGELDVASVDAVLQMFEGQVAARGASACVGVDRQPEEDKVTIFVLREFRETSIREVRRTVFVDEAQLVVLHMRQRGRVVDERSYVKAGPRIAAAIARELLGTPHVEYVPAEAATAGEDLRRLIDVLGRGEDRSLRLRELRLKGTRIDGSPELMLRCDKDVDLTRPLMFLETKDLRLLRNTEDIDTLGLVVERVPPAGEPQSYIMRVTIDELVSQPNDYIVRYCQRGAGAPLDFRRYFEAYLKDTYNVVAIPGTRP